MHDIIKATYLEDYKLLLTFKDKKKKVVDFDKLLNHFRGEIFRPLKKMEYFKQFKVNNDIGTVVWPNEADVCPDVLYEKGVLVKTAGRKSKGIRN